MVAIQRLEFEDLDKLAPLYEELVDTRIDMNKMRETFKAINENSSYNVIVAKVDDKIAGSVMGIVCLDMIGECRPFMVIENVIVSDTFRGKGIGRLLMEHMEEIARRNNCLYIMFVSGMNRKEAHKFYETIGYSPDAAKGFRKFL